YQHACAFNLVAELMAGRAEKAWSVLDRMVPDFQANPSTQSRCEPYTITNSYLLEKNYYGEAVTPWRTGTAGWAHRGLVEFMLGVRKDYAGLRIQPCLPARIARASVRRVFRGNTYHIEIDNTAGRGQGVSKILFNGAEQKRAILPLAAPGAEHRVQVVV
ncbi:MAG: cellobiose phosphorylase, partial [Candidatus Sumerlaeota bacterium]|nr:cellobiose phosphorylase [Candidatus Sumerlaeota bacterium]